MPITIRIKNMVCHRCVLVMEDILRQQGIAFQKVLTGEVCLRGPLSPEEQGSLEGALRAVGFEIIDNRAGGIIERIKNLIRLKARNGLTRPDAALKLSALLSAHLHLEYTYLSSLYSSVEGRTIEASFIDQRIEYVKELLIYGQMNLSQIALEMEYSSTAHLSAQFKKVTGLTPSQFKEIGAARRRAIDGV